MSSDNKPMHSTASGLVVGGLVGVLIGLGIGAAIFNSKQVSVYGNKPSYYITETNYNST